MKRNIGYIELIVILCLVVIAVKAWTYKKPENKPKEDILLPMATPIIKSDKQPEKELRELIPIAQQSQTTPNITPKQEPTYIDMYFGDDRNLYIKFAIGNYYDFSHTCPKDENDARIYTWIQCKKGKLQYIECKKCGHKFPEMGEIEGGKFHTIPDNFKEFTVEEWIELLDEEN